MTRRFAGLDVGQNPDDYVFMYVNPKDNEQNLAPGYIQNILERMPELKRKRFL